MRYGRRDGWIEGEVKGGGCGFSSLMKQKKKGKICFVIYMAAFFFTFFSVMKCLAKQKQKSSTNYYCRGRQFSCGRVWAKRDEKNANG